MATFTPKNFPKEVGNNKAFSGAGERTTYAPTSATQYKFPDGFFAAKPTSLYNTSGKVVKSIPKEKTVYFTYPAKLLTGAQLNITGAGAKSTFAGVSLSSWKSNVDGYVMISHIVKPGGGAQNRVAAGSKTQDMVAEYVQKICYSNKMICEDEYTTARPGSTAPDLEMTVNSKGIQFEIKGTNNRSSPITFFDKSASRTKPVPKILDEIAHVFIKSIRISGLTAQQRMQQEAYPLSFIGAIDYFKSLDPSVGLAGDQGVVSSGKLPPEFSTTDASILKAMRDLIIDHFEEGGDDYFVVHDRSTDNFEIYFVGKRSVDNVLNLPMIPKFTSFTLATYGGASSGSTRCGLKIKL